MSFDVTHVKTVFKRYSLHIMPSFSLLLYDTWTLYNTWSDNKGVVGDLPNNLPLPNAWLYEMPRGHC